MTGDRVERIRDGLARAGWKVRAGDDSFGRPGVLASRYPAPPPSWVDFVDGLVECVNPDDTAWFLTRADYAGTSGAAFAWDVCEQLSLESADGTDDEPAVRRFWDRHLPIFLSVGGDYGYLALVVIGTGASAAFGPVVQGFAPDWEGTTEIAPSFEAFLTRLDEELGADDPGGGVASWLLL